MIDRFIGSLMGLAVGDALGTTLEFTKPGEFTPILDMNGGGPFNLNAGEWTDDTSMALCLGQSIIDRGFDPFDQMYCYRMWLTTGYMSSNGECFDIGNATFKALDQFSKELEINRASANPFCGSKSEKSAGNGSIMRLAPVVLRYYKSPLLLDYCVVSSETTHGALECLDACKVLGSMIASALRGQSKDDILNSALGLSLTPKINNIAKGSYRNKKPPEIRGDGYVVLSLEAALWAFYNGQSFEDGLLKAVNLGEDADTTGAVYGQLAGAYYGYSSIPSRWRVKVAHAALIEEMARKLYDLSESDK